MSTLIQDLRYGLRMLAKNPGFTSVAILTLALGIGANTAVFSVINAALLRFLPVPSPQQLVYLQTSRMPSRASETGNYVDTFNFASFRLLRTERRVFSDVVAFVPLAFGKVPIRFGKEPEQASADMVSGNFFSGLGVRPARGQTFTIQDETRHGQVAVLSYDYWTRRFARDPGVIGQTIYVKSVPFTIVGVAARGFTGIERTEIPTDLWIPFQTNPDVKPWARTAQDEQGLYSSPSWWFLMMVGRLQPGVTWRRAIAELQPVFQRVAYDGIGSPEPKEELPRLYFSATGGIEKLRENYTNPFTIMMAMVAVVLLIACINVAMLLVARNAVREREFSLRVALGASCWQLLRQLLAESLLLVGAGTLLAWIFALWGTSALAAWSELNLDVAPDHTVLAFTVVIAFLVALALGLAPLRNAARVPPGLALKASASNVTQSRSKFRGGQVVVAVQVALCLVLLVGAGLLIRTQRNLENANLGFRASGLLVFGVTAPRTLHTDPEILHFYQSLTDRLRALPGVESATLTENRIGSGWSDNNDVLVDGVNPRGSQGSLVRSNDVGPDFCHVLGVRLLLGRDFTDRDTATAPRVAIVNETFAKRYVAGRSPIGHQIKIGGMRPLTIVGVTADSKYTSVREQALPIAYVPYMQESGWGTMAVELRAYANPLALLPEVRRVVADFGPDIPLLEPMTQQAQMEESYSDERLFARLSMFFGILASLLVATGLYGTLAYKVSRRTAEIGIRMALGAERRQVLWMVLRESLVVASAGIVIGLPLAFAGARLLGSMLFGLKAGDVPTFIAALAAVLIITLASSLIPARRAAKVDPMVALRNE